MPARSPSPATPATAPGIALEVPDRLIPAAFPHPEVDIEIKRSHFLARALRATTEDEAREAIASVRSTHPDARHNCSAFIVSSPGANLTERSSDDGEPAGTAGTPMLDVIRGSGVTNVAVVVTRYFGGVLLGTGGLVRAYSQATAAALEVTTLVTLSTRHLWDITLEPIDAGRVEADLRAHGVRVESTRWTHEVRLTVSTRSPTPDDLATLVAAATKGQAQPRYAGITILEIPH